MRCSVALLFRSVAGEGLGNYPTHGQAERVDCWNAIHNLRSWCHRRRDRSVTLPIRIRCSAYWPWQALGNHSVRRTQIHIRRWDSRFRNTSSIPSKRNSIHRSGRGDPDYEIAGHPRCSQCPSWARSELYSDCLWPERSNQRKMGL